MDPASSSAHHTRGRKRHRADLPCDYCGPISARCVIALNDSGARCTNCVLLGRECDREGTWKKASKARKQASEICIECRRKGRTCAFVGTSKSCIACTVSQQGYCIPSNSTDDADARATGEAHRTIQEELERQTMRDLPMFLNHYSDKEMEIRAMRGRSTSPEHYSDNKRTRSQSPGDSFYHSGSPVRDASPIRAGSPAFYGTQTPTFVDLASKPVYEQLYGYTYFNTLAQYQYTPLLDNEIRLLRISPGSSESRLLCSLKVFSLDRLVTKVHEFQALSYAWGDDTPTYEVFLSDLPRSGNDDSSDTARMHYGKYLIRENLNQALRRIRLTDDYIWLWVDCLCIEQGNEEEKSRQIPKMPSIYSSAWNVIAWLGDDYRGANIGDAVRLVPDILNLNNLDYHVQGSLKFRDTFLVRWVAFSHILRRPWFRRRWVIQEVACARKLSVRIADKVLSWLDFADAVDLFSDHFDQMRVRLRHSAYYERVMTILGNTDCSAAVALMRFSRNVFQRSPNSSITSRLMSLESLVLTASPFAVSNARDTIYALLYLANDMQQVVDTSSGSQLRQSFAPDYLKHPVDIFKDFVRYSIAKSKSLDVLYRQWASWSRLTAQHDYHERLLPSWIGVANFDEVLPDHQHYAPLERFLGPVGYQTYDASHGVNFQKEAMPPMIDDIIQPNGILLGTVEMISSSAVHKGFLENDWLRMLGWRGSLDEGIDDRLWRTLVANRNPDAKTAPTWYRRACALALTQLNGNNNLASETLLASNRQPSTLISYLERVQEATANRKIFRCASSDLDVGSRSAQKKTSEAIVGLGPEHMSPEDENLLCVLYGSSVPVILCVIPGPNLQDDNTLHVKLVGPCYAHGHMEGEIFAGMSETEIKNRTMKFSIH